METTAAKGFQQLESELDGHLSLYEELLAALEQEKDALLARDLEALGRSTATKEELAEKITAALPRLSLLVGRTAALVGLDPESRPSLARLAREWPQPEGPRLARKAARLAQAKNELARRTVANRAFINEALSLVNGSVAILTGAKQLKGAGYTASGQESAPGHTRPVKLSREV